MEVSGKMSGERGLDELRRAIHTISGASWAKPGKLYHLASPHDLVLFDAAIQPSAKVGTENPSPGEPMAFSPSDEVIPLELDAQTLWGYWVIDREFAASAHERVPELMSLLCRLHDGEETAKLERMNRDLMEVLGLGESLGERGGGIPHAAGPPPGGPASAGRPRHLPRAFRLGGGPLLPRRG